MYVCLDCLGLHQHEETDNLDCIACLKQPCCKSGFLNALKAIIPNIHVCYQSDIPICFDKLKCEKYPPKCNTHLKMFGQIVATHSHILTIFTWEELVSVYFHICLYLDNNNVSQKLDNVRKIDKTMLSLVISWVVETDCLTD